jgi:TolA-binding protein
MESDIAQTVSLYKLWGWFDRNKKQVTWGAGIVVIVGLITWFVVIHQAEKEVSAGEAVSGVALAQAQALAQAGTATRPEMAAAYLKVADLYPSSVAGARALLLAAGSQFAEGKYDEAKAQFQKLTREHRDSPFMGEALLGIAACLDAQGKTADAIAAYKELIDHHPAEALIPQAKFSLASLYERQNNEAAATQARTLYIDVERSDPYGSLGPEAGMRVEELQLKYPSLAPKPQPAPNVPSFKLEKK